MIWQNIGFRNGCVTENCLLIMLEFWKHASRKSKALGLLLTDPLQAFVFLFHDLRITKFHLAWIVLGFFIKSKGDSFFSFQETIILGLPQEFIFWFYFYSILTRLGREGGQFDSLPCGFSKNLFFRERMKTWFFATFNIILSHIPKNSFRKFEDYHLQY